MRKQMSQSNVSYHYLMLDMCHQIYIISLHSQKKKKKRKAWGRNYLYPYLINGKTEVYLDGISHPKSKWKIQDLNQSLSSSRVLEFCWWPAAEHLTHEGFRITQERLYSGNLSNDNAILHLVLEFRSNVFQVPWGRENLT